MNIRKGAAIAALSANLFGLAAGAASKCGSEAPPSTSETTAITTTEKVENCMTTVGSVALLNVAKKQFQVTSLYTPPKCVAEEFAPVYKYNLAFTSGSRDAEGQKISNGEKFTATCIDETHGLVGVNAGIDKGVIIPEAVVVQSVRSSGVLLQVCSPSA